jgi:hypothetical protein
MVPFDRTVLQDGGVPVRNKNLTIKIAQSGIAYSGGNVEDAQARKVQITSQNVSQSH